MAERVHLALGSNLGDRAAHLATARARLGALPGTSVVAASPIEETAPLGGLAQPPYLNQMVTVATTLAPDALLAACHAIERDAGRRRHPAARWSSRTLDIDVVLWEGRTVATAALHVPHPGLVDRPFWQRGLDALGVDWRASVAPAGAARGGAAAVAAGQP